MLSVVEFSRQVALEYGPEMAERFQKAVGPRNELTFAEAVAAVNKARLGNARALRPQFGAPIFKPSGVEPLPDDQLRDLVS